MARPGSAQTRTVNPVLTNLVIGYANSLEDYIGEQLLKPYDTLENSTGTIYTIARGANFGDPTDALVWADGARPHESAGFTTSTTTFACKRYADSKPISRRQRRTSDIPLDLKATQAFVITEALKIAQERRIAAAFFNASNFTANTTLAGANQWSASTSNPAKDINLGVRTVKTNSGRKPNTAIFGQVAWEAFKENASVLSFAGANKDRQILGNNEVAQLLMDKFEIKQVFVGQAGYNTANPNQTVSLSPIWGDYCWIGYLDMSPQTNPTMDGQVAIRPTAVARFVEEALTVAEVPDDLSDSDHVVVHHAEDIVVTSAYDGYLIIDTAA